MSFKIPDKMTISGSAISDLIRLGDGDAALLHLYIAAGGDAAAAIGLPWSAERTRAALDKLVSLGLSPDSTTSSAAKTGTATSTPQPEKQFYALTQEIQRLFGRILSSDELVRLFSIYDSLGLPTEVILQLVVYCTAETQGRSGTSSPPSMKYIEKAAYTWAREGIFTLELAERYILERNEKKQENAKIKAALQIQNRNLTPTERKYVDGWLALGFGSETVAIAYDRTVTKTGKLSWGYMNSIINSWHSKSLFTVEDILAKDTRSAATGSSRAGGVVAAPDDKEVARINRILSTLNEEKKDGT